MENADKLYEELNRLREMVLKLKQENEENKEEINLLKEDNRKLKEERNEEIKQGRMKMKKEIDNVSI
jgi:hypothetical protein